MYNKSNKLIDEFMDMKPIEGWKRHRPLGYHKSYDYLMPVVEKIYCIIKENNMNLLLPENTKALMFYNTKIHSKLNEVYRVVVEFIKWYNNQIEKGNIKL